MSVPLRESNYFSEATMPLARKHQIDLAETSYYHCIARCVRRAFLCGNDPVSERSYEHRKTWVIEQLRVLTDIFAISICAYAVMSNHYHLVLNVNPEVAASWSAEEILLRQRKLNKSRFFVEDEEEQAPIKITKEELDSLTQEDIEKYRNKLTDISAFMGALNEYLARRSNSEDNCTGRFWEGRFKSYALLDDTALLTCMAYVDLNPIRAGMAINLEESDFTSIQKRIAQVNQELVSNKENSLGILGLGLNLTAFMDSITQQGSGVKITPCIPCSFEEYRQLVEWTGRQVREDKTGHIPSNVESLLTAFSVEKKEWLSTVTSFEKHFSWVMGSVERLRRIARQKKLKWVRGVKQSILLYSGKRKLEPIFSAV